MARSQLLYAKVARRIHGDRGFRGLKRNARLAWFTLLTSEHQSGLPGFWRAPEGVIVDELVDFSVEEWRQARAELEAAGMLRIDDDERLVWLVNAVRPEYNAPDNPNIARSWGRKLAQFDPCDLFCDYLGALLSASERWARGVREAFLAGLEESGVNPEDPTTRSEPAFQLTPPDPKGGRKAKPTAPTTELLEVLARCPRFLLPEPVERSHRGMLADLLRLYAIEEWPVLVEWVAAGGGWPQQIELGRLRKQASTWMPQAKKWDAADHPDIPGASASAGDEPSPYGAEP